MGPKIFQKKVEKLNIIGLLPIGGYVSMEERMNHQMIPSSFNNVSAPSRIAVVAAGAIMNFILAIIVFFYSFFLTWNANYYYCRNIEELSCRTSGNSSR